MNKPQTAQGWAAMLKDFYTDAEINYRALSIEDIEYDLMESPYGNSLSDGECNRIAVEVKAIFNS